ncbi:MAG: SDR family oxidoreductase [Novosphingobium sp.]
MNVAKGLDFTGRSALIVGAGAGIGEAIVRMLATGGCKTACVDVDTQRAEAVAAEARALGVEACALSANILDDTEAAGVVAAAQAALGDIDILVTVVGSTAFRPLLETSVEDWDLEQRINLRYVFIVAREFAALRVAQGGGGAICNVASVSGIMAATRHAPYGAAKAGLIHLVKTMATEWAPHGIRVNAVAPGSIITPRLPDTADWRERVEASPLPLQRRGTVEEIAGPVAFLCSDLASYVTGQTIAADGGLTIANTMAIPPKLKSARVDD